MINGAHAIVYSKDPGADRAFLRDVLKLPSVDVGEGWLIFGLPPSEVAVHPSEENDVHELYFMCDDVQAFIKAVAAQGITCGDVHNRGWGLLTELRLPGGGKLGVYQPRHARPRSVTVRSRSAAARTRPASTNRAGSKKPKPSSIAAKRPVRKTGSRR